MIENMINGPITASAHRQEAPPVRSLRHAARQGRFHPGSASIAVAGKSPARNTGT